MQMHNASQHLETILEHSRHLYTMSRLHQHHYYIYIYIAIVGGKYSKSNITEEKRMDPCIGGQPGPKRRRCKCKYKIRWFYSKGAFLVLVWVLLSGLSLSSSVTFRAIQPNQRYDFRMAPCNTCFSCCCDNTAFRMASKQTWCLQSCQIWIYIVVSSSICQQRCYIIPRV